ncbi:hypothetical protein CPLU01_15410 [Colletotrichum plurivorum]|uniref:Uncharacterized protein n=1 Tax=Colletotrichum plurivorum TaxID=2175906 RepID=A0A8H6MVN3_9PEZI|nr:hypothetical protein CPLU01_15410 [Colletotrichum plurivorum]
MTIASIMKEAQSTFGKNGPAQDILVALQDSGRGRRPTLALTGLMNSMNRCNDYVGKVSTDFGKIIETARELHLTSIRETENLLNEERHQRELLAFTVKTDQGCDNTTLPPPSGPNSINLNSVIEQRQLEVCKRRKKLDQTLIGLISWTQTTQYIQTKMNEISCRLKELNHDQAAAGETSKALKDGVDFLSQIESGFCRIKNTFDAFAGYIDKGIVRGSGKRLASALEDTSEHALKGQSHCSQAQARSMIDIVLEMRGQFMVVHDMAKVCLDMFHEHGMPCIQKTCWLELWDTIRKTIDSSGPSLRTH